MNEKLGKPEQLSDAEVWENWRRWTEDNKVVDKEGNILVKPEDWSDEQLQYVARLQREKYNVVNAEVIPMVSAEDRVNQIGAKIARLEARLSRATQDHDIDTLTRDIARLKDKQRKAKAA